MVCLTCAQDYYALQGICQSSCPVNYPIVVNRTCTSCSTVCATCDTNPDNCTTCTLYYFKYLYTCVESCPIAFYSNVQTYTCDNGLNGKIVFFPILITYFVLFFVVVAIFLLSRHTSIPTVITALSGFLEIAIWIFLLSLLGAQVKEPDVNYVLPIILLGIAFLCLIVGNVLFFVFNHRRVSSDIFSEKWIEM